MQLTLEKTLFLCSKTLRCNMRLLLDDQMLYTVYVPMSIRC